MASKKEKRQLFASLLDWKSSPVPGGPWTRKNPFLNVEPHTVATAFICERLRSSYGPELNWKILPSGLAKASTFLVIAWSISVPGIGLVYKLSRIRLVPERDDTRNK